VSYPPTETGLAKGKVAVEDIRRFGYSALDRFVMQECDDASVYRKTVTKVFLAGRFVFGLTGLVTIVDVGFRAMLLFVGMRLLLDAAGRGSLEGLKAGDLMAMMKVGLMILAANLVHIWSLVKG